MSNKNPHVYCSFQDAPEHTFPGHPESPRRVQPLRQWLQSPPYPEIKWLNHNPATEAEVLRVHHPALLKFLQEESRFGPHEFEPSPSYMTPTSYQAALGAAGATLAVSRQILAEGTGGGFAIVRPPGHHAEPDESMGFCLLNNIAIAAADAVASGLNRVAIVDIDAHHGNGTEVAFWNIPEVGFLSTHEQGLYPGTGKLNAVPHAPNRIINLPMPRHSGNTAFLQVFSQVVEPWLLGFQPEMIFVSAGFDAHFTDQLTTLTLDTTGYFLIAQSLVRMADALCQGRLIFVLEGGYDPLALKDNIGACLAAMGAHNDFDDHYGSGPDPNVDVNPLIDQIINQHHIQEI